MTASIHEGIMQDWNWSYGYGIAKDVANGKDVFVHHENCLEACKFNSDGTPRVATGYSWIDGVGEKHSGPIGEDRIWFERRDKIYYITDPEYPNIAFEVTHIRPISAIVDIDEEIEANQRSSYASDSSIKVKEVFTPQKKKEVPMTPKKKVSLVPKASPHVGIPASPKD